MTATATAKVIKFPRRSFVPPTPRQRADLVYLALDDLIAHVEIILKIAPFTCDCELCLRWQRICIEATSLYYGGPAESKADAACGAGYHQRRIGIYTPAKADEHEDDVF